MLEHNLHPSYGALFRRFPALIVSLSCWEFDLNCILGMIYYLKLSVNRSGWLQFINETSLLSIAHLVNSLETFKMVRQQMKCSLRLKRKARGEKGFSCYLQPCSRWPRYRSLFVFIFVSSSCLSRQKPFSTFSRHFPPLKYNSSNFTVRVLESTTHNLKQNT